MSRIERNPAIEFYRCLLMFGICWLHAITLGTVRAHPLAGILMCCVPGFVFISGWFGITFKPSKLIKLYAVGAWCAAIVVLVARYFGTIPADACLLKEWVNLYTKKYWFLHAYAALMLLAPLVNAVVPPPLKSAEDWRHLWTAIMPLFILVFGWNWLKGAPVMHKFPWPETAGLGSNTALTLLGVYAFATVCRATDVLNRLRKGKMMALLFVSFVLCWLPFSNYHFIFSSVLAAIGFHYCYKIKLPSSLARFVTFIAPSMFSVYLLHSEGIVFKLIGRCEEPLIHNGVPMIWVAFAIGLTIFSAALIVDLLRRLVLMPAAQMCGRAMSFGDEAYSKVVHQLGAVSIKE